MEDGGGGAHPQWGESLASYPETFLDTLQRQQAQQEILDSSTLNSMAILLHRCVDRLPRQLLERLLYFSRSSGNVKHLLVPGVIPEIVELIAIYCGQNKVDPTLPSWVKEDSNGYLPAPAVYLLPRVLVHPAPSSRSRNRYHERIQLSWSLQQLLVQTARSHGISQPMADAAAEALRASL